MPRTVLKKSKRTLTLGEMSTKQKEKWLSENRRDSGILFASRAKEYIDEPEKQSMTPLEFFEFVLGVLVEESENAAKAFATERDY